MIVEITQLNIRSQNKLDLKLLADNKSELKDVLLKIVGYPCEIVPKNGGYVIQSGFRDIGQLKVLEGNPDFN